MENKKLVLKFWKPELGLAMQIIEQTGFSDWNPRIVNFVQSSTWDAPSFWSEHIFLRNMVPLKEKPVDPYDIPIIREDAEERHVDPYKIGTIIFESNQQRDEYLQKVVNSITKEIFPNSLKNPKLEAGKMCEVRGCEGNDDKQDDWLKRKLLGILQDSKKYRFIAENTNDDRGFSLYKEARPLVKEFPKVEENGPVVTYTWDEE